MKFWWSALVDVVLGIPKKGYVSTAHRKKANETAVVSLGYFLRETFYEHYKLSLIQRAISQQHTIKDKWNVGGPS